MGFPHENIGFNTYHNAIQCVVKELLQFESQVMTLIRSFNQDVVEPLELFMEHYDVNCKGFIQEANCIFKEIDDGKKKAMKEKDEYLNSAAILDSIQLNLKKLKESASPKDANEIAIILSMLFLSCRL